MEEDKLIEQRQKKIIEMMKKDKFLAGFIILCIASLIFSVFSYLVKSTYFILPANIWLVLFIASAVSSFLIYYKKRNLSFYPILAWVVWFAVWLRTRNLPGLRDTTTGGWALGPDLDPYLFLRWAKYIVEHGALFAVDTMRYVPFGYKTNMELLLHPYMMAWFHKIAALFGSGSVEQSAALYPVFFFAITVIAFFLLTRKIFLDSLGNIKASTIAIIASVFLTILPSFLLRTIAGIPEKESAAFFFFFVAFYFFLCAWKSSKLSSHIIFGILAGLATAGMALVWGGFGFIYLTLAIVGVFSVLTGHIDRNRLFSYAIWILVSFLLILAISDRYPLASLVGSTTTGSAIFALLLMVVNFLIWNTKLREYTERDFLKKIPPYALSLLVTIIGLAILALIFFGPSFFIHQFTDIKNNLIAPVTTRLIRTVAENMQPFFTDWAYNFGPLVKGIPILFWLFFIGSAYLFSTMIKTFKAKDKIISTSAYVIFLAALIFSRYSADRTLNGTNAISVFVYAGGVVLLLSVFGFYYYKYHKSGEFDRLKSIDTGILLLFALFFLSIISARGAVRLVMMLVPPISMIVAFFAVSAFADSYKIKDKTMKLVALCVAALIIIATLFSGASLYKDAKNTADVYYPNAYNIQWQKAMSWVRESTPQNAVFAHWWDYGYWLQSIGQRATVLDGGNAISYWNHMMGRYGLTGTNETETLDFFYAHNVTHFLIDSTDIGKYGAFSSIGSDKRYDRTSFIPLFDRDDKYTQESKNKTTVLYSGGIGLDEDIIYEFNGSKVFFPAGKAALGGIFATRDSQGKMDQPQAIFIYQNNQYSIPLRYSFENKELTDFGSGLDAGIFFVARVVQNSQGATGIDKEGSILYLSKRTIHSQLAKLYLFNEQDPYFKLAHSEDDLVVAQVKSQYTDFNQDFISYGGLRGPIRIWQVNYPADIQFKEEYLLTDYPEELSNI